tara:strand:- start:3265 stop:4953 length:1689 start_codon:yes stop_codon:yes gene_type:complete
MALLDMIGVASILPFITVLTSPDLIETNPLLNRMFDFSNLFGVENNEQFVFALGVSVFLLFIVSIIFRALTNFIQVRFIQMREYSIGKKLVQSYLCQPYTFFLSNNSAAIAKTILSEVDHVIGKAMTPLIDLISKGIAALVIIVLLIIIDIKIALIIGLSFSISYLIIFYYVKNLLKAIGEKRLKNNHLRFTSINESFGAAKEVKVGGLEEIYINNFSNSAKNYAKSQYIALIIAQLPRYVLEAIAFGGIFLILLYTIFQKGTFNDALPVISLYVFAGYRLMPAIQQIYGSFTQLTFAGPSVNKLFNELNDLKKLTLDKDRNRELINFNETISLKNIQYDYPNTSSRTALKNINLTIPSKSTVGIIGHTGSGKTTVVDIILGLLVPQRGTLEIDGEVITNQNLRSWQRLIGYVPQHIFLSDDTIAANIAFGVDHEKIDKEMIKKVSKIANLHDFVDTELQEKYETIIGERGVRLSGGQRQRIGIARALYNNPKVIILDEATSALDIKTEKLVMAEINKLCNDKTIIIIAHRIDTIRNCDIIFKLEKGRLLSHGLPSEILNNN